MVGLIFFERKRARCHPGHPHRFWLLTKRKIRYMCVYESLSFNCPYDTRPIDRCCGSQTFILPTPLVTGLGMGDWGTFEAVTLVHFGKSLAHQPNSE